MFNLLSLFMLFMLIPTIILILNSILSMNLKKNREKMTPFECGFDPLTGPRLPFSIQFFMIALMFLIFDIEIMLMLPMINLIQLMFNKITMFTFITFLLILIFTLWLEWSFNYLKWIN